MTVKGLVVANVPRPEKPVTRSVYVCMQRDEWGGMPYAFTLHETLDGALASVPNAVWEQHLPHLHWRSKPLDDWFYVITVKDIQP